MSRTRNGTSAFLNGLAALLLAALIAVSIVFGVNPMLSAGSSNGIRLLELSARDWNVGVTVIGTAVGILSSIAFGMQDSFLSRLDLASRDGVSAIFLRPLTSMRSLQQILRGEFNPERLALVALTLGTTLTSAATVALLSVQTAPFEVANQYPSFPLAALNATFFYQIINPGSGGDSLFPLGTPSMQMDAEIPNINSFLYKSALINGQQEVNGYITTERLSPGAPYLPVQGLLGETIYSDLWTTGVGINTNSYFSFVGENKYFPVPRNYTFSSLKGNVFGTIVNATCENRTSSYSFYYTHTDLGPQIKTVARKDTVNDPLGRGNVTLVLQDTLYDLTIGSNVTLPTGVSASFDMFSTSQAEPVHVFVVASGFLPDLNQVYECTYDGQEVIVEVSVDGPGGALVVGEIKEHGPPIGASVKRGIAGSIDRAITGGSGGILTQGFIDSRYNRDGNNNTHFGDVLGRVLSQSGQAVLSTMRQQVEVSSVYGPPMAPGADLTMKMTVRRVGGGSLGWVAVYGVQLLGCLLGLVRALWGGKAVRFEAQDASILLAQAVGDNTVGSGTKIQFVDDVGLVRAGGGSLVAAGAGVNGQAATEQKEATATEGSLS